MSDSGSEHTDRRVPGWGGLAMVLHVLGIPVPSGGGGFNPFGPIGDLIEDGANAAYDLGEDVVDEVGDAIDDVGDFMEDVGEGYLAAFEVIGEGIVELGEELDDAFSKEGWMTTFMEDTFPGGGLITAAVHAAAGNTDYAEMAALKGGASAIEFGFSYAGSKLGGPLGGMAGAAIGSGLATILELKVREELPESVRHLVPPATTESALTDMGLAAAMNLGGRGSKNAIYGARKPVGELAKDGAQQAAEEAVERTMGELIKAKLAKEVVDGMVKQPGAQLTRLALTEMGAEETPDRPAPTQEDSDRLGDLAARLEIQLMTEQRIVMVHQGASDAELLEFDKAIFSAAHRIERIANPPDDSGFWRDGYEEGLGSYQVRAGVVVWDEEQKAEAHAELDLEILGVTREEYRETWIEERWARDPGAHPEWTPMEDYIGGTYMVKEGEVVWGTHDPALAQEVWVLQEVHERGFGSVEEYRDSIQSSWITAHQYQVEAGTASGEWQMGGQTDLVGPYMIKDGQVVWGASTPAEAEEMLPDQLATEKGFADAEALRAELVESWRVAHQYDKDAGTDTGEWQMGGQSDIVGPYMVKDGVVVFGAENEAQAEAGLPTAIAQSKGFATIEEFKANLEDNWRMAHEYNVESGTATGEWEAGGQTDVVGPYMIKDGQVVYGARNAEQAEAILRGEPIPVDESMPEDQPTPEDESAEFGDGAEMKTGGPYIVEDDGTDDFDILRDEKQDGERHDHEPEPVEPTQFGDGGEMKTGGPYIVEDDGHAPTDFVDVRDEPETGGPHTAPETDQADLIRRLMEQVERLEHEIDGLRDDLAEAQSEPALDMPAEPAPEPMDEAEADDFDAPPAPAHDEMDDGDGDVPPDPAPEARNERHADARDGDDSGRQPVADELDDDFDAPATPAPEPEATPEPEPVSNVQSLMAHLGDRGFDWQTQELSDLDPNDPRTAEIREILESLQRDHGVTLEPKIEPMADPMAMPDLEPAPAPEAAPAAADDMPAPTEETGWGSTDPAAPETTTHDHAVEEPIGFTDDFEVMPMETGSDAGMEMPGDEHHQG